MDADSPFRRAWLNPGKGLRVPKATSPQPPARTPTTLKLPPAWKTPCTPGQPRAQCLLVYCLCLTTLTGVMWLWRTLPNVFFLSPIKRRNMLRNQRHCSLGGGQPSFRTSRQPVVNGRGVECSDECITLGQDCDLVIVEIAQTGP